MSLPANPSTVKKFVEKSRIENTNINILNTPKIYSSSSIKHCSSSQLYCGTKCLTERKIQVKDFQRWSRNMLMLIGQNFFYYI